VITMLEKTTHVPILVRDQDKALEFYVGKLGFEKRQDYALKGRPRWLTVAPPGAELEFALVKGAFAIDPRSAEGYQFTLKTSDCRAEVAKLKARGVEFRGPAPAEMPFGLLASFQDPDGNRFALLQPA
jgi:predicted enzyme related to lactoylglutathione lyase